MTGMRSGKKVNCLVTGWFIFLSVLVPHPITVCARQYLPAKGINFNLWNFYFWYTYCVNLILCFINCFPFYSTTLILQSSCLLPENRLKIDYCSLLKCYYLCSQDFHEGWFSHLNFILLSPLSSYSRVQVMIDQVGDVFNLQRFEVNAWQPTMCS